MLEPSARLGGAEAILLGVSAQLPRFDIHPLVLCLQHGPLVEKLRDENVNVAVYEAGRLRQPHRILRTSHYINGLLKSGRFDLVYSNLTWAHVLGALPARLNGVPAMWCQMGFPSLTPHWLDRIAARLPAVGIVALSSEAAAAQQAVTPRIPVHLAHPGIDVNKYRGTSDLALRTEWGVPPDAPLISIVGRLQEWKGQREFLQAAAKVLDQHPECYFAVVGGAILGWEGSYPDDLRALAHSLQIQDQVVFTGHTEQASRWFSASDVAVNASSPEPFGLVVIEAMASECAVIAIDAGGPRDIIEDGVTGLLCSSVEPNELASKMCELLNDPGRRRQLGRAGRVRVQDAFTTDAMAQRFAHLFRQYVLTV